MVGMATRASNNQIRWSGIGGKGKHILSGLTVKRKLSMNGHRNCLVYLRGNGGGEERRGFVR